MTRAIGIDLGTTYCAVAKVDDSGQPVILPNVDGDLTTPSVVLFQETGAGDEPLVGAMAKQAAAMAPFDVVQFVKRHMGDPSWRFDSSSGATYTPEEVSAIILRRLKQDAELALGHLVTEAVITVPAYFDDARRTATQHAGRIAGLQVLRVLNEPTAAALAFGIGGRDGTVLVYDLGGGTFDVTAMRISDGHFDVLATDGDRNLGGFDFDNALMRHVATQIAQQGGGDPFADETATAALREQCETAKRSLTSVARTMVQHVSGGRPLRVQITRELFEQITADLLGRTEEIMDNVLSDAGLEWSEVDHVVMVGGSTRMPMCRELVRRLSGKDPVEGVNPDQAVALGAAIQAQLEEGSPGAQEGPQVQGQERAVLPSTGSSALARIEISDVTSQALGVVVLNHQTEQPYNRVVIPRNSKVPGRHHQDLATVVDNQASVRIEVTQGDDEELDYVTVVGGRELPIPPHPKGSPIRVIYAYDRDQTIGVELIDLTTEHSLGAFAVERVANLSEGELQDAAQRVSALTIF